MQSNANFDLRLRTGNPTSGDITIENGAVGEISISPDGTGLIELGGGGPYCDVNAGTAGTNVTAVEYGNGRQHTTVLTLANADLGNVAGGGNLALGALIYTFPAGAHVHSVTSASVALQGDAAVQADTPDVGVGSVIGSGAVAVLGGTATFEDYLNGTAAADVNGTATVHAMAGATAGLFTGISFNATGDAKTLYYNAAATWSGASAAILATGTVTIQWTFHG